MKIRIPGTVQGRIATSLVVALVIVGTAFVANIAGVAEGDGLMTKIFLVFFGAIVALQVIPGLMLIGAMLRGLTTLTRRDAVRETGDKE